MTTTGQNFTAGKGDDVAPIFTVVDGSGAAIDISGATEITWLLYTLVGTVVLTKKKTISSGVTLVSGGTTGKFQVNLTDAELALLSGIYRHSAVVTDSGGNDSTVELGKFWVLDNGT